MAKNIDIVTLRSFATVVQQGGVSKAAKTLHVTQSAISQHIKRLETLLNTQLFERSGRQVQLTASGDQLMEYATRILATNDEIIQHFNQQSKKERLAIGISEHISHIYLPRILSSSVQNSPHIEVDAKIGLNQELYADLNSEQLDIALLVSEPGIHSLQVIAQQPVTWVSSPDIKPEHFSDSLPIVVYGGPCMFRTMMISILESHKIPWKVTYTASSIRDLKAALEAKMGFSALLQAEIDGNLQPLSAQEHQLPGLPEVDIIMSNKANMKTETVNNIFEALKFL